MNSNQPNSPEEGEEFDTFQLGTDQDVVITHDGQYFIAAKHRKGIHENLMVSSQVANTIIALYSEEVRPAWTVRQIAEELACPDEVVASILRAFGVTHKDMAASLVLQRLADEGYDEESTAKEIEDTFARTLRIKRAARLGLRRRESEDAARWQAFKARTLDPFEEIIKRNVSTPYAPRIGVARAIPKQDKGADDTTLCVALSDLHFGNNVYQDDNFQGASASVATVEQRMLEYLRWIRHQVSRGLCGTEECHVFSLGDILHSLSGYTTKGTLLTETHPTGSKQWDLAEGSVTAFLEGLARTFKCLHVHAVSGNHDETGDWTLLRSATNNLVHAGLLDPSNVDVNFATTASTHVRNTYVLYEHGAKPKFKRRVPKDGPARAAHIIDQILEDPAASCGDKERVFLCGDGHSREYVEYKNFQFIRNGSMFNTDFYARENGYGSRPSQTVFCVGDQGVSAVLHKQFT